MPAQHPFAPLVLGAVPSVAAWLSRWIERSRCERGRRAEQRQRDYQTRKAARLANAPPHEVVRLIEHAERVRARIAEVRPIDPAWRVLEVGSGPHGNVFFLGHEGAIGVDPLADLYGALFPMWQRRARTVRASGEALPFGDACFDLVISDDVIDHAAHPETILDEIARVLRPGELLYLTVHVHHPVYSVAAALHATWNALGVRWEIDPFADHTTHFTAARIRAALGGLPLRIVLEDDGIGSARAQARRLPLDGPVNLSRRVWFKNARFEVVAIRR